MSKHVEDYLARQKEAAADENLSQKWNELENLYRKKLWHQITEAISDLVFKEEVLETMKPLELYENVIYEFEHRINPVKLMQIGLEIARRVEDPQDSVKFLQKLKNVTKSSEEAQILALIGEVEALLRIREDTKCTELPKIRDLIEEAQKKIDAMPGITSVHGEFYRFSSAYLREIADFTGYYKEALRYLGCVDEATLSSEGRLQHALCLALAALLGEDVYNFGELLAHPILTVLESSKPWLVELLRAFNAGDLAQFEKLRPQWSAQPDLLKNELLLRRKICLLCLMEMAYIRPANKRQIPFSEIAQAAKVGQDEVELLVMKALALKLVKGYIDQVDEVVNLTWVQPRVLDRTQIGAMGDRVMQWHRDVQSMHNVVDHAADEIITRN